VKLAAPGSVIAPTSVATAAGLAADPLGPHALKGFDGTVDLCRLIQDMP
jgi:class 3 adenylate cyclase